jgi:uridine kinase
VDKPDGTEVTEAETAAIREHMKDLVARDIPFRRHEVQLSEAIRIFKKLGYDDKVKLLQTSGDVYITYYTLQDTADYFYDDVDYNILGKHCICNNDIVLCQRKNTKPARIY